MSKILITGALGYIGFNLVNYLAKNNKNNILAVDIGYFHKKKFKQKNVNTIIKNIDKLSAKELKNVSSVVHLAAISNDPSALINSKLSWETNVLGTYKLLNLCKKVKIKKFIFASSGSVYGIKKEKKVHENLDPFPISDYNKTKMVGERVVESFSNDFLTTIIRPATVCGFSESMRYDLTVNAMTYSALKKDSINVFGGSQCRPNICMNDMLRVYEFFLRNNYEGIFNAGFENYSINQIANKIIKKLNFKKIELKKSKSNDIRSYRLDSSKIIKLGFKPENKIEDAVYDLFIKFKNNQLFLKTENLRVKHLTKLIKK